MRPRRPERPRRSASTRRKSTRRSTPPGMAGSTFPELSSTFGASPESDGRRPEVRALASLEGRKLAAYPSRRRFAAPQDDGCGCCETLGLNMTTFQEARAFLLKHRTD